MSGKARQQGPQQNNISSFIVPTTRIFPTSSPPPHHRFTFDAVYGADSTQREIYDRTAAPIVDCVMEGYNGTIFAYGQTGAGKSHTMEGCPDPPELRGITPNAFKHVFDQIGLNAVEGKQFLVRASYLEIYNEEIRDLLSKDPKNKLELKENVDSGVYVKDLTSFVVKSVAEIDHVLQAGKKNRSVGATLMNQESSRSHSIFTIIVETSEMDEKTKEQKIRVGKLNLVDLAGSERQSKTGATGDRLKEAIKINQSLSALGNVISALVDGKSSHIPYRDSKLTRLLQDSLGGNTKTVMIANCGPAEFNYDETLSTLRYANRAKNIKNKPKINEDPKDAMLREFQDEIARLREKLAAQQSSGGGAKGSGAGGRSGGGRGGGGGGGTVRTEVVEKVIVKEVGMSEEELKIFNEKTEAEKAEFLKKAEEERRTLLMASAKTDEEKRLVEEQLAKESEEKAAALKAQEILQKKLKAMEEKLLMGGKLMDKAAAQEESLRRARIELEERKKRELAIATEIAENEEEKTMMGEKFASLGEEVEAKTKKLKKLWTKYQAAKAEVKDVEAEFQRDRVDMVDTIRELSRQIKLRSLIIDTYIPAEEVAKLEKKSKWSDENDNWIIPKIELAGNNIRPKKALAANAATGNAGTDADGKPIRKKSGGNLNKIEDMFADAELNSKYKNQGEVTEKVYLTYNSGNEVAGDPMEGEEPRKSKGKSSKRKA
jgi:hypothetical protein